MLAIGLGSIPSIAKLIEFLLTSIVSGINFDILKFLLKERSEHMAKVLVLMGLGICDDMA